MKSINEQSIRFALALATDEQILSEYGRRMAKRRKVKTGGVIWEKHNPRAKRGCRCPKCWEKRIDAVA